MVYPTPVRIEGKKPAEVILLAAVTRSPRPRFPLALAATVLLAVGWKLSRREAPPQDFLGRAPPTAPPAACKPLAWPKGGIEPSPGAFDGVLGRGTGRDANDNEERFLTLVLDDAVCTEAGEPVGELQLVDANEHGDAGLDVGALSGRRVRLEGYPFAQHTAHHHRPIVLTKKVTPR